jgi:uncharacterized Zn finger protein (UPF0148 family)
MRQEMSPHKCKTRLLILLAGAVVCASCREVPITEPVKRGEDGQREQIGDQRPKLPEQSLSSVGSEFDEKVRALSIALGSESWDEREHATDMLISLGEKARKWLSAAETAIDPEKASRARFVCKAISLASSMPAGALRESLELVKSFSTGDLEHILSSYAQVIRTDQDGMPLFNSEEIAWAAEYVVRLHRTGDLSVPSSELMQIVQDISMLGVCPSEEFWLTVLSEKVPEVKRAALYYVTGPLSETLVSTIEGLLEDESPAVRGDAAWSLGRNMIESAVPRIRTLLTDKNENSRWGAVVALGLMRDKGDRQQIVGMLSDRETIVRMAAAAALGDLSISENSGDLARLLVEDDVLIRRAALESLVKLGEDSDLLRAKLSAMLRSDYREERTDAVFLINILKNLEVYRRLKTARSPLRTVSGRICDVAPELLRDFEYQIDESVRSSEHEEPIVCAWKRRYCIFRLAPCSDNTWDALVELSRSFDGQVAIVIEGGRHMDFSLRLVTSDKAVSELKGEGW